jgi:ABC-2 type transport system permease protein
MIASLRKYYWIALMAARTNLAYVGEVAARSVFLAILLYIYLRLWTITYAQSNATRLGDLSLEQMLWYLVATQSIYMSTPKVAQNLDQDVRTGTLAVQLVRPLSFPLYYLWNALGERSVRFGITFLVGSIVALILVGPAPLTVPGYLLLLAALPFAFCLDFLGYFLVGLGAFWLEDTSGVLLIYQKSVMLAGGLLIPMELFPDSIKPIVQALPFSSIVYGPAHLFVHPDLAELGNLLLKQGVAICGFTVCVWFVWTLAVKRVHAMGG